MQDRRRRSQRAATSQSATSRDRCAPVVVVCRRPSAGRHAGNISAPRENEEILYLLHIKVGHPLLSALHVCALDLSAFEGEATPPLQLYLLYVWLSVRLLICLCIRMRGGSGGGGGGGGGGGLYVCLRGKGTSPEGAEFNLVLCKHWRTHARAQRMLAL